MTMNEIKTYYESEYKSTKRFLENLPAWANEKEVVNNAIQRMLGVAQFVQYCDVPYEDITELFEEYRNKNEAL